MERVHRRSLPHWYMPGAAHFVTYRLAGTLPANVLEELKAVRERLLTGKTVSSIADRSYVNKVLFKEYDRYLDQTAGRDWLGQPEIALMLRENLYHHDGQKYVLHAYCIMPNHVHVLFTPRMPCNEGVVGEVSDAASPLSSIMHSMKSYTANEANRILKRTGAFWQSESYDHWVRDDGELERVVNYIRGNPVSAGLVSRHEDWRWCSCYDRFQMDGDVSGWLPARSAGCQPAAADD